MKIAFVSIPAALALILLAACGNPNAPKPQASGADSSQTPMRGYAGFGSQCVSGFNTDPKGVKLELWSCPFNVSPVELAEPLQPLFLSADCGKKLLTIRSPDKTINSTWELMPDGSFYFTQEGLNAKLKADGSGNTNCNIPLTTDLWGHVDCAAPTADQAQIHLEMVMWMNHRDSPHSDALTCKIPSDKCYFHAITSVAQCR